MILYHFTATPPPISRDYPFDFYSYDREWINNRKRFWAGLDWKVVVKSTPVKWVDVDITECMK